MPDPAITVEVLPAGYGDSLLVSCPLADRTWRLLIDTGPDECLPTLAKRLAGLPVGADGMRHIDLAVISHIDHDHIGGAAALFADKTLGLQFGDIWFNAPRATPRGVAEGVGLTAVLGQTARGLPWNQAFDGADAVTPDVLFLNLPAKPGEPRITLLSPNRRKLDALYRGWARELPRLKLKPKPQPVSLTRGALDVAVAADGKLTHRAEVKLTHPGDDDGLLAVADVDPGAGSGDQGDGPQGRGSQGDREAAGLLAQHGAAVPA